MESLFDPAQLQAVYEKFEHWLARELLVIETLVQALAIVVAFFVAYLIAPRLRRWLNDKAAGRRLEAQYRKIASVAAPLTLPLIWLFLQWILVLAAAQAGWPHNLNRIVVSLLTAWVVIRLGSNFVRDPGWAKTIAIVAWLVAALNIVGWLQPTGALLDDIAIQFGGFRISALLVLKGVFWLAVLLWVATFASAAMEQRIRTMPNLTPSIQVLFGKLLKIVLITMAIVIALNSVGIDLTAFAVLGGAIGVGIGFGLQKIVSNLISGVILLMDKSIKPGDVISVGETYGWINSLGARYASVVTRDGTEYLIPNEELITTQVINWSFSNNAIRLKIPIGISYKSDVRQAIALCLEAAAEIPRIEKEPKPACLLKGFGDSSVDLELRIWIDDPQNGVSNVKSEALLLVWDKFHAHEIEIPFPQRDLHIIPPADLDETVEQSPAAT